MIVVFLKNTFQENLSVREIQQEYSVNQFHGPFITEKQRGEERESERERNEAKER